MVDLHMQYLFSCDSLIYFFKWINIILGSKRGSKGYFSAQWYSLVPGNSDSSTTWPRGPIYTFWGLRSRVWQCGWIRPYPVRNEKTLGYPKLVSSSGWKRNPIRDRSVFKPKQLCSEVHFGFVFVFPLPSPDRLQKFPPLEENAALQPPLDQTRANQGSPHQQVKLLFVFFPR